MLFEKPVTKKTYKNPKITATITNKKRRSFPPHRKPMSISKYMEYSSISKLYIILGWYEIRVSKDNSGSMIARHNLNGTWESINTENQIEFFIKEEGDLCHIVSILITDSIGDFYFNASSPMVMQVV